MRLTQTATKVLSRAGFEPVTFDNLSTGWQQAVKFGPFEQGDLLDRARLDEVFAKHQPIAVMHFAAFSQVGESMSDPGLYWRNNVGGSLNLIEAAVAAGCKNFVFSSTCATYGEQDGVSLDEQSAQMPINAYGASKRAIEDVLANFAVSHGLEHVIFRYFNVAGADPDGEVGEFHQPETHLIPLVLSWLLDNKGSAAFNLGTGSGFSVKEVIDNSRTITNRQVPVTEGPRRPGDCTKLVSGSDAAREKLGWTPTRSTMEAMVSDA